MNKLIFSLLLMMSVLTSCNKQETQNDKVNPETTENEAFLSFAEHFSETASFAFADVSGYRVLLVSQETFGNNINDVKEGIEASIFALDAKGKIVSLGSIRSQGTNYPVSLLDGKLMVAGHQFVRIYSIRGEVPELVLDQFGDENTPELDAMFQTFEKGTSVKFNKKP